MKSQIIKKLTVLLSTFAIASVALVGGTVSPATAAAPTALAPWTSPINFNSNNSNAGNNSTGEFTLPAGKLGANLSLQSAVVPFGTVVAGDVITLKLKLIKVSDNSPIEFIRQNNCVGSTDLYVPERPVNNNGCAVDWSGYVPEISYSHTVSPSEVTSGVFRNFNSSNQYLNGTNYQNYQSFEVRLNTPTTEALQVKLVDTWTKNNVAVTPTSKTFYRNLYFNVPEASKGFDIDQNKNTILNPVGNNSGAQAYTGGCFDLTGLAVGNIVDVVYSLTKKDGTAIPKANGSSAYSRLNWSADNNFGGIQTGLNGYLEIQNAASGTFTLPPLTQGMLDGVKTGGTATNVMIFNANSWGLKFDVGSYKMSLKAQVRGTTTDLVRNCNSSDVVNLSSTKVGNDVVIKFTEPGVSKLDKAWSHYCQLRDKNIRSDSEFFGYLGGVAAVEVTPATSPRSFTCTLTGLPTGESYTLGVGNQFSGWNNKIQTTWLSIKASPNVATDPTVESVGIGTATTDLVFDSADASYDITSTDDETPYPNVVTSNSLSTYVVKLGGTVVAKPNKLNLVTGKNVVTIEVTSPSGAKKTYTFNITKVNTAADATLTAATFGSKVLTPAFSSATTNYSANVSSTTTTYPFPSVTKGQSGSTVVYKNGASVVSGPGDLALVDGPNVITVEVTAPNGTTKKTYTFTITKAPAAKDAGLSALPTVSGVTASPAFNADVTKYTGGVSESTTTATLGAATTAIGSATTVYKLNGAVVTAGNISLRPGANVLETIVTSSDGTTTKTYTETITRAVLTAGGSSAANDARQAVNPVPGATYQSNGQTVTGFDSEVTSYTKNVPVNQTEVSLTSGGAANASSVITSRYSTDGGTTWTVVTAPATVPLAAGKTTKIETTVTNGTGTKVYTTDVVRPAEDTTSDVAPAEGDGDTAAKGIPSGGVKKFVATNDSTFQVAWDKATGKLISQATGIYTGHIEAKVTFTKAGKTYSCTAQFGTLKVMPQKTPAQKVAAMKSKIFVGKQFCIDKTKLDSKTTAPAGGFTKTNFVKIKAINKTAAELKAEVAALAALKGFTGEVAIQVIRYRAWPTTMWNLGDHTGKGGKIPVQIRDTKIALG